MSQIGSFETNRTTYILLLASIALMLGAPLVYHALNFVIPNVKQDWWLLACPVVCFGLCLIGILRLQRPKLSVIAAILASIGGAALLSLCALVLLVLIGVALAFAGAPGYDLM